MDIFNFKSIRSIDVTKLVQEYKGKSIEELFPNHEVISNEMGQFLKLQWIVEDIQPKLNLVSTKKALFKNLKSIDYIGENIENGFNKRGVKTLHDLKYNLRFSKSANEILKHIKDKDYKILCKNRHISDFDVSFCFDPESFLFIDIETLGIYDSPMIMVGLGFFKNKQFQIEILFARDLEEEIAMCEHLKNEILPNFKSFVSYNGKTFDIPYIANRFLYFYEENPMITEGDTPYEITNSLFHHIDLYHACRRRYKGMFENYTLTNMEEKLINLNRENELPSSLVGLCYRKYQENPKRYVGLIKEIIEHNYYDVYSMPLIFQKLLE